MMKRFLIVKTSAIGDVIQTFPIVDLLKNRHPDCRIDWVVEKGIDSLVQAHPKVDKTLVVDTKKWRRSLVGHRKEITLFKRLLQETHYDAVFDLQGNTKSACVTAIAKADKKVGYSFSSVPEKPGYLATNVHIPVHQTGNIRTRYFQLVRDFFGVDIPFQQKPVQLRLSSEETLHLNRLKKLVYDCPKLMICFGSNWKNKRLSEKTLLDFLYHIHDEYSPAFYFIHGNNEEKLRADRLVRAFSASSCTVGHISLPLWQRLMEHVDGVIAMDSAALHLCGTTATPSFSVFGPSSAHCYKPFGEKHRAYQGQCPYGVQFDKRCPQLRTCETGACIKSLSADHLFDQFQRFWSKIGNLSDSLLSVEKDLVMRP